MSTSQELRAWLVPSSSLQISLEVKTGINVFPTLANHVLDMATDFPPGVTNGY